MKYLPFLLGRNFFPRGKNLLSMALWVAAIGVALGIMQLMVVLSVFNGFHYYLKGASTRFTSELVLKPGRAESAGALEKQLASIPGLQAFTPFQVGQAMLIGKGGVGGAMLEGLDPVSSQKVTPWEEIFVERKASKSTHWIWLGSQLAKKLQVSVGDTVSVMTVENSQRRYVPFEVTGITHFGIYDNDLRSAKIDLGTFQQLFGSENSVPYYKTKLASEEDLEPVMNAIEAKFGSRVRRVPWYDFQKNHFEAVTHQKRLLFYVLEIVVALAAINVINLLIMNSQQRRRDIAILRAMGMRFHHIVVLFTFQGALIGLIGIALGIGLGSLACEALRNWQPALLQESIYNVTKAPLAVELGDITLISGVAFVLCALFSVVPAVRAAMERPVAVLRYE